MLILPNDILNDTPADATPVEQNYSVIEQYINTQVIGRDGSVAMTGQLHLVGDPLSVNDAARKGYVDALLPVGVMLPFCGQVSPAGSWALCNGASLATATYPKLFAVLGYRYGGSGGTFMIPNMAGRFPIGMDTAQTEFSATGKKGGTFTVPVPLHLHPMPHTHTLAHTHEHVHTHTINHDHGSVTSSGQTASHQHVLAARANSAIGASDSLLKSGGSGTSSAATSTSEDATHTHTVNLPTYLGASGGASDATTGAASTANTGGVSVANTSNAGVSGVEMQPPFVVINYIVRVD